MSMQSERAERIGGYLAARRNQLSGAGVSDKGQIPDAQFDFLAGQLANLLGRDKWSSWGINLQDGGLLSDALADLVWSEVFMDIVMKELAERILVREWDWAVLEAEAMGAVVEVRTFFDEGLAKGLSAKKSKKGISAERAKGTSDDARLLGMVIGEHLACSGKPTYNPATSAVVREVCRRRFETGSRTGKWSNVTSPAELIADLNLKRFKREQLLGSAQSL